MGVISRVTRWHRHTHANHAWRVTMITDMQHTNDTCKPCINYDNTTTCDMLQCYALQRTLPLTLQPTQQHDTPMIAYGTRNKTCYPQPVASLYAAVVMYMYIHICIHLYVCMYVYIYIYIHTYIVYRAVMYGRVCQLKILARQSLQKWQGPLAPDLRLDRSRRYDGRPEFRTTSL